MKIHQITVKLCFLEALLFLPFQGKATDNMEGVASKGCETVTAFIFGATGVGVARLANKAVAVSASAAGFAAVADASLTNYINVKCTESMVEHVERASKWELGYEEYINDYCNGQAFQCSDPLLDIGCYTVGCAFPPQSCDNFIVCGGIITGLGTVGVSANDFMDAMLYMGASYDLGSWDTQGIQFNPVVDNQSPYPPGHIGVP